MFTVSSKMFVDDLVCVYMNTTRQVIWMQTFQIGLV